MSASADAALTAAEEPNKIQKVTAEEYPVAVTLTALDVPPSQRQIGPLVKHLECQRKGPAAEVLAEQLHLPQDFVARLISFGAAYYCPVHPKPSQRANLSATEMARVQAIQDRGLQQHGTNPKLRHPKRLVDASTGVTPGGFFRVHLHPRRFPRAYVVCWRDRIIAETDDFVAVNKPWGVQVPHRVDNVRESIVACVSQAIGHPEDLLPVHRLDAGTEGVTVLAKTASFARYMHSLMSVPVTPVLGSVGSADSGTLQAEQQAGRKVAQKVYRALLPVPAQVGVLEHWAVVNSRTGHEPAYTRIVPGKAAGAVFCSLAVEQVEEVSLCQEAQDLWGRERAFEHVIRLRTGRTHQIRAQLAAVAAPLLGDSLYQCLADGGVIQHNLSLSQDISAQEQPIADGPGAASQRQAAVCEEQKARSTESSAHLEQPAAAQDSSWIERYRQLNKDDFPLGLQAARLTVAAAGDNETPQLDLNAGEPWWRQQHCLTPDNISS